MSMENWDRVCGVNLTGALTCIEEETAAMKEGGTIVTIASGESHMALPGVPAYVATKHALLELSREFATAAPTNSGAGSIRYNTISPGTIRTPLLEKRALTNPLKKELFRLFTPLGRVGEPEEIARIVVYLTGESAALLTGQDIVVDGGALAGNNLTSQPKGTVGRIIIAALKTLVGVRS
jgi:NAD(P)-dependent dehydrogenase (short-subunit alcohol dehydrogenase family)